MVVGSDILLYGSPFSGGWPIGIFIATNLHRESTFVTCRGCGQRVFHSASKCPACRHRMRLTDSEWQKIWVIVAVLLVAATLIWMVAINSEM